MIEQVFVTTWSIYTPKVFRLMERQYVDRFFETGELMLSSYSRFSKHEDEQRKDDEGRHILVARGVKSHLYAVTGHGHDAYVLCSTACHPTPELCQAFKSDAAIRILETTGFAAALTKYVPGVRQGFEGYCNYADGPIESDDADADVERMKETRDLNEVRRILQNLAGKEVFFRKRERFRHQLEYRWIWMIGSDAQDSLVIEVPEARQFCRPWYSGGD